MKKYTFVFALLLMSFPLFSQYIDGGNGHTIILCEDSTVVTFGENNSAQLGIGTKDSGTHPNPNSPLGITKKVKMVAANDYASYILLVDGTVMAWGQGVYGQIGDGTFTSFVYTPTPVLNLDSVIQIEGGTEGDFVMALRADGTVWGWGDNTYGQLGIGNKTLQNTPQQVLGLDSVIDIAASAGHSLALRADGTVWSWGANSQGQLGLPLTITDTTLPVKIDTILSATNVETGAAFSMVVDADSTVWAFGYNQYGQLGINQTFTKTEVPTKVYQLDSVIDIMCGRDHVLAMRRDGTSWGWGEAGYNQIGVNTVDRNIPFKTNAVAQFVTVNTGSWHSFGTDIYGNLYSFGRNTYGQLGTGSTSSSGSVVYSNYNSLLCKVVVEPVNPYARLIANPEGNPNAYRFQDTSVYSTSRLWDFGDGTATDTAKSPLHQFSAPGIYNVCLYAFNQFGIDTTCVTIEILATGINELANGITVTNNQEYIILSEALKGDYAIYNMEGKLLKSGSLSKNIPIQFLTSGIYFISLNEFNKKSIFHKFIISK
ncbi:MAG: PKD domain-containing protein [Flavobacteriales bacterium]